MRNTILFLFLISTFSFSQTNAGLGQFANHSDLVFNDFLDNGTPYREMLDAGQYVPLHLENSVLSTVDGSLKIIFHENVFKYSGLNLGGNVWLESEFPYLGKTKIFYAAYSAFSSGPEISIIIAEDGTIQIEPHKYIEEMVHPSTTAPKDNQIVQWFTTYSSD
ncbi:MAG: hypothetical protein H0W50_09665 [Parachlamydiaceae bacterium]|nr:hypothetical protein [Parachlamydiaceae bacterium]